MIPARPRCAWAVQPHKKLKQQENQAALLDLIDWRASRSCVRPPFIFDAPAVAPAILR